MGVRGTTFFVKENDDGRSFICVCEGTVNARWVKGGEEIKAKKHDAPKWIVDGRATPVPADMGNDHTDDEIAELKKLL
jgi:hypothetical protein